MREGGLHPRDTGEMTGGAAQGHIHPSHHHRQEVTHRIVHLAHQEGEVQATAVVNIDLEAPAPLLFHQEAQKIPNEKEQTHFIINSLKPF